MNSYTVTSDDEPCKCSDRFEMMNKRLKAAEKLLEPLSVLEVCGRRTMQYDEIKKLLDEFWQRHEQNETRT